MQRCRMRAVIGQLAFVLLVVCTSSAAAPPLQGKQVGRDKGAERALLRDAPNPRALAKQLENSIRKEIAREMEEAEQAADFGRDCKRTFPGKDIIDTSAPDNGDISLGEKLTLDACCRTCDDLAGSGCKAVVWNTANQCFFKSITGPLVDPGKGTAQEGGKVTAAYPAPAD